MRQRELTIQYQLTLDRVKNILIYLPSQTLQDSIGKCIRKSNEKIHDAVIIYNKVERDLLKALNISDYKPSEKNVAFKKLSESLMFSGRLDAEYYQEKYDEIMGILKKLEHKSLQEIVSIKKSVEPGSKAYQTEGIPFLRVGNVSKYGLSQSDIFLDEQEFSDPNLNPRKDDILLSKDGSIGIAYKIEENLNVITSSALLHLTITDKKLLPDYLTLVLNSVLIQMQAERDSGGSIIQHWRMDDVKKILIPIIPIPQQKLFSDMLQDSFVLRKQSNELFDKAKTAVEIAIDYDESLALQLLSEFI